VSGVGPVDAAVRHVAEVELFDFAGETVVAEHAQEGDVLVAEFGSAALTAGKEGGFCGGVVGD